MDQTVAATADTAPIDTASLDAARRDAGSHGVTAIERLADKISALVELLDTTRRHLANATLENEQLRRELDDQGAIAEQDREALRTLRAEREQLQTKVAAMLDQLEEIEL